MLVHQSEPAAMYLKSPQTSKIMWQYIFLPAMAQTLGRASQRHKLYCHDLGSNPGQVERSRLASATLEPNNMLGQINEEWRLYCKTSTWAIITYHYLHHHVSYSMWPITLNCSYNQRFFYHFPDCSYSLYFFHSNTPIVIQFMYTLIIDHSDKEWLLTCSLYSFISGWLGPPKNKVWAIIAGFHANKV